MSVIYLLISISIIVAVCFFIAFIRAVKSGQYDDDYTPSVRMLFDDELVKEKSIGNSQLAKATKGNLQLTLSKKSKHRFFKFLNL